MLGEEPKLLGRAEMKQDIISNLPDTIIDQILSHLPIRDAARTSILSSKWRYKWAMLPYLVFDDLSFPLFSQGEPLFKTHPMSTIDHVLMLHVGPIQSFKLNHRGLVVDIAIDRWILQLSRGSIKEFSLHVWNIEKYSVPSSLFSCRSLTSLMLCHCLFKPPSTFKGFRYLKSLEFRNVEVAQDVHENLISSCPVLERLKLEDEDLTVMKGLNGCCNLSINAPNLLHFDGRVNVRVSFENTLCLAEVIIRCDIYITEEEDNGDRNSSNMLKFFYNLPSLRRLCIDFGYLQYLSAGFEPSKLPSPCFCLEYLSMELLFNNEKRLSTALAILSIAPNLRQLKVLMDHPLIETLNPKPHPLIETIVGSATGFWENCRNVVFNKLQLVEVLNVCGDKPELDFIKFMISNSPSLERLIFNIDGYSDQEPEVIEKQVLNLRRFTDTANIICLGVIQWSDYD